MSDPTSKDNLSDIIRRWSIYSLVELKGESETLLSGLPYKEIRRKMLSLSPVFKGLAYHIASVHSLAMKELAYLNPARVVPPFEVDTFPLEEKKLYSATLSAEQMYHVFMNGVAGLKVEQRPTQKEYLKRVAESLRTVRISAIEGQPGIGKTVGYGLPSIEMSSREGKPSVISTFTKILQDQIALRDAELLRSIARKSGFEDISYVVIKGQDNYFCPLKFADYLGYDIALDDSVSASNFFRPRIKREEVIAFLYILTFAFKSPRRASFGDISFYLPKPIWKYGDVPLDIWERVISKVKLHGYCLGDNCPYRDVCNFYYSRSQIKKVNLAFLNHAFLLTQIKAKVEDKKTIVDPVEEVSAIVVDEAHNFFDAMKSSWGKEFPLSSVEDNFSQLFSYLGVLESEGFPSVKLMKTSLEEILSEVKEFYSLVRGSLREPQDWAHDSRGRKESWVIFDLSRDKIFIHGNQWWSLDEFDIRSISRTQKAFDKLLNLKDRLKEYIESFEFSVIGNSVLFDRLKENIYFQYVRDFVMFLRVLLGLKLNERKSVYGEQMLESDDYITVFEFKEEPQRDSLKFMPRYSGFRKILDKFWEDYKKPVVFTSATLFDNTARESSKEERLFPIYQLVMKGKAAIDMALFGSDYDFENNMRVYYFPDAENLSSDQVAVNAIVQILRVFFENVEKGGVFIATSNFDRINKLYEKCQSVSYVQDGTFPCFRQKRNTPTTGIVEAFKESFGEKGKAVLIGNQGLWQGLDLPGEQLNLLIIWKELTPFPDPWWIYTIKSGDYRAIGTSLRNYSRGFRRNNLSPQGVFSNRVQLYYRVANFRQALGRLIRGKEDRGVVFLIGFKEFVVEKYFRDYRAFPDGVKPVRISVKEVPVALDFLRQK